MAKVESVFKLRGSVGDLTFRETQDGTIAQNKPGPSREKVLSHENFKRTRLLCRTRISRKKLPTSVLYPVAQW
jgi:hypothetical protein